MALWLVHAPLVLASQSAARRAMLEAAGIPIEVRPAVIDERAMETSAASAGPGVIAALLAREKALKVASNLPARLVVGADQTLALDDRRFSKPADRAEARGQLLAFAGRTHQLMSAVAVARDRTVLHEHLDVARLTVRRFSESFLDRYLDAAASSVTESVGGYQLERLGIHLFDRVEGDHFTILGLPLLPLLAFFRQEGYLAS